MVFLPGIEEITKGQAYTNTRKLYRDVSTGTAVFLNQKRVNVCEHTTKTASLKSLRKVPPGGCVPQYNIHIKLSRINSRQQLNICQHEYLKIQICQVTMYVSTKLVNKFNTILPSLRKQSKKKNISMCAYANASHFYIFDIWTPLYCR